MQATDLIIQTREACGDARQMPAAGKCALGHLYRHGAGLQEAFDTPSLPLAFGNAIERNFGRFDLAQRIDVLAGVERVFDQFATNAHQLSQQGQRSEEHTSELQSLMRISYAVFCLKKKKHNIQT